MELAPSRQIEPVARTVLPYSKDRTKLRGRLTYILLSATFSSVKISGRCLVADGSNGEEAIFLAGGES